MTAAGCARCFFDKASGKNADRPELARMFDYVRPGDALTVVSLDRLGRSLEDLIAIVGRLKRQGVGFLSLHEKLDTTTAGGMFVFHIFAALAEFIRTIIVANTNEGLAAARARGQRLGRPPAMTPEKLAYARQLLAEPDRSISAIAKLVGVSRSTIYKALPELLPPQLAQHRLAAQIAALRADTRPTPDLAEDDRLLKTSQAFPTT
ncbi:recombinase family protein [Micromonospora sp. IBHARD004]|uniref:recombinase family protein n=1 Tax=Micromonospora sp. IBHARD004 TaxID=3457764 RepID=UPI004057EFBD